MNMLINIAANDNFQQHKFLNALHYEKKILFNLPEILLFIHFLLISY